MIYANLVRLLIKRISMIKKEALFFVALSINLFVLAQEKAKDDIKLLGLD
jgi:hypothetical protein